jgi:hypothetical protein
MLVAPPGATVESFGLGGDAGNFQAHASIQSTLDLRQIADHFGRLLLDAGWKQDRAGATGPVAWSSWTCPNETGEQVGGFFLAVQQGEHVYALQLDRDVAPGSRAQAEAESREQARTMAQAAAGEYAAQVDTRATGESTEALRELIQRIVAPADADSLDYADPQLIVGRVPDTLPVELPLPPASRVIGSLVMGRRIAIHLQSETLPRQILAFYRTRLSSSSWTVLGERRGLGGFKANGTAEGISVQFCPVTAGPAISVDAHVRLDGMTEAQIAEVTDLDSTPCGDPNTPLTWEHSSRQPQLPVLIAPPYSDFVGGGGRGSDTYLESQGYLYMAAGLREVAAHYRRQFEIADWKERDRGEDGVSAWSRWRRHDEGGGQLDGLFLTVQYPDHDGYLLLARASRFSGSNGDPQHPRHERRQWSK